MIDAEGLDEMMGCIVTSRGYYQWNPHLDCNVDVFEVNDLSELARKEGLPDCVEIAEKEGITAVIQPGGSVKDDLSFAFCNDHGMAMVTTVIRHFKH